MNKAHKFKQDDEVCLVDYPNVRGKIVGASFVAPSVEFVAVAVDRDDPEISPFELPYSTMLVPAIAVRLLVEESPTAKIIYHDFRPEEAQAVRSE